MSIAKKLITNEALTFQWADGTATTILFDQFSSDIKWRAEQHGFSAKLGDSYSGAISVADAKIKLQSVLDGLIDGDWNRKGSSSGGIWVEAYAEATDSTLEEALAAWTVLDNDEQAKVKKHPDVIEAKAEIELARAKAKAKAIAETGEVTPLTL